MFGINIAAVIVAAIAAFIISIIWYILFGEAMAKARASTGTSTTETSTPPWKMGVEIVRNIILASVIAYFVTRTNIQSWADALPLALVIWIGFPLMVLSGSVLWENVPWKLAAIHAGDWLVKLLAVTLILGIWR
jgi:glycerol uptake facilitator-like aquaporin